MSNELKFSEQLATDAEFRKEFINNPQSILATLGIVYPAGTSVVVKETVEKEIHFPIPALASGELGEAQLEKVSGGAPQYAFQ